MGMFSYMWVEKYLKKAEKPDTGDLSPGAEAGMFRQNLSVSPPDAEG